VLAVPIFVNIVLLIRNASWPELARASNRSRMSREVLIHLSLEMRLIGVSEIAAHEVTPELVRGVHDDEAASRRVYDKITRPSDRTDELSDQTDRLDVRVNFAVDFFRPSVRNAVIVPGAFRGQWRLLQHQQKTTAPPRPVAVAHALAVPSDEVNTLEYIADSSVISLAKPKRVGPLQQIATRPQYAGRFATTSVDIVAGHRRQTSAAFLTRAFVAYLSLSSVSRYCGSFLQIEPT
jgi:hypothetical protein